MKFDKILLYTSCWTESS